MKKKIGAWFSVSKLWQFTSTAVIVGAALALLLISNIETLLPGYSVIEIQSAKANSVAAIIDSPINAPYRVVALVVNKIINEPLLAGRISAAIFGILTIGLFYIGVRHWHAPRTAFLTTVLFACSAWFLHIARLGAPDILLPFSILLLAVASYWIATAEHSKFSYLTAIFAVAVTIYTPGIVWFILLGLIIRHRDLRLIKRRLALSYRITLYVLIAGLIVIPLLHGITKDPKLIMSLLGLPEHWPSVIQIVKNLLLIPVNLFMWASSNPLTHVGTAPIVDAFVAIASMLGIYYYFKFRSLARAKLLAACVGIGAVLIAIQGPVSIAILLPMIYILVAGGISLLLGQWLTVFPKNPFAKSIGILIITIAVSISCAYNLRAYFIAWPNNTDTKREFAHTSADLIQ